VQAAAELQEQTSSDPSKATPEIWEDVAALQVIRTGAPPAGLNNTQKARVLRRAKHYAWDAGQLLRILPDGSRRVVPPIAERVALVKRQHELCGHFGSRRTAAMLLTKYWWYGLLANVTHVVARCEHCGRVNASFTAKPEQLQPIPISSLGFRWHVDTAGPFPKSSKGNTYVLVAVEAFSKHLEVIPMRNKEADTVAYAFLHHVLARFAAPGQVVSDNGTEFQGPFSQLLLDALIDHRHTSPQHPVANGQAEKAVHIVKTALRKVCSDKQSVKQWDEEAAWLALGYRCSPQRSTGFTPYELLYARPPVVPPAVADAFKQPLDLDDPQQAIKDLLLRKQRVQHDCPIAMRNLSTAQHRDQLRYSKVRAADYTPRPQRYSPGDYVYVQQLQRYSTLQPKAKPVIYRVVRLLESGVLELQGRCGTKCKVHMSHCAPCHLPGIDGSIDPVLSEDIEAIVCEECGTDSDPATLLLCDVCNSGYHVRCLQPPLAAVPAGSWLCPRCMQASGADELLQRRQQQRATLQQREQAANLFPSAVTKRRDARAKELHGRLVLKPFKDPATGYQRKYWGRISYLGELARPYYLHVMYEDGDSETATVTGTQRYLVAPDVQLPAGVTIPGPGSNGSEQGAGQSVAAAASSLTPLPSIIVPLLAWQQLHKHVQLSWAQCVADPITCSNQWHARLTQYKVPFECTQGPVGPATAVFCAPTPEAAWGAIQRVLQMRPVFAAVYMRAGTVLPSLCRDMLHQLISNHRALLVPAVTGRWLLLAGGHFGIRAWLKPVSVP
jgi:transposase InsO family protein